jgi:hypothetical protein
MPMAPISASRPGGNDRFPPLLYLDGIVGAVPCMIVDISTTGARLHMKAGWDCAFKFAADQVKRVRLVERIEKVAYECQVIRRGDVNMAVKFTAPPVLPPLVAVKR